MQPDVPYRTARGGQKLRNIMLEGYIDLYGPYVSRRQQQCCSLPARRACTCTN
jgi:hypothetical protein